MPDTSKETEKFTRRVYVNSDVDTMFRAWTTPNGIEKWFLSEAVFYTPDGKRKERDEPAEKGDTYEWKWFGFDYTGKGEVVETNGKDHFEFTFWNGGGLITIDVVERNGKILVELNQEEERIKTEDGTKAYSGTYAAWTYHFANLKSVFEGGLDLREKEPDIADLVNS